MKHLITILALAFGFNASATDAHNFRSYGFSNDGRFYAFVESVVQDGSGFPEATAHVVDVAQNRMLVMESVVLQNELATEAQAIRQALAKANLAKYGISGKVLGRTLWTRLPTDLSDAQNAIFSPNYYVNGGASTVTPVYELNVAGAPSNNGVECYGYESELLTVSLSKMDGETLISEVQLQKDKSLPTNRECAYKYSARHVIEHNGAVVAVLRYFSPGFEGPNYNHMVVTHATALK